MKRFNGGYKDDFEGLPPENADLAMLGYEKVYATSGALLFDRRKQLGMTQQQVADAAGILLRQYQRLEKDERSMSGASMRIGLSVCRALQLDPNRFI